ncbi:MAG: GIY-YIG nuclease family protein [Patescibacteria group bacterium]
MFTVYVIENEESKKIYIGQTANLKVRLDRHNGVLLNKATSFTAKNKGKWNLIYREDFDSRDGAVKREKELKSFRGREFVKSKSRR